MNTLPLPKRSLGFFPTPLVELRRLSQKLGGPRLLMKRDDMTGLAFGGNKTRKLEYFVGEALAQGCDTLVTGGAEQSNHCRQTAAAAAACGLACHLVLGGRPPETTEGNLLLDRLLGATVHWAGEFRKGEKIPEIAEAVRRSGGKPYTIPYGGSNPSGAAAFVEAVRELAVQLKEVSGTVTHIVFASSSGGTHAGLVLGKRLFKQRFQPVGIEIDKGDVPLHRTVAELANATAARLGVDCAVVASDIILKSEYLGAGYGVVGDLERKAIRMLAEIEGILVDPVYTGRAMGALIDMAERGEFSRDDTVLFWHTGGTPALFLRAPDLLSDRDETR